MGVMRFQKELLKLVLLMVVVAAIIAGILRGFFVTPVRITNDGMAPTLIAGEQAYMWRGSEPTIGSIAVCQDGSGNTIVGRVVLVGPGTIAMDSRGMIRSGRVEERDLKEVETFQNQDISRQEQVRRVRVNYAEQDHEVFEPERGLRDLREIDVPADRIFLLGDHRGNRENGGRGYPPMVPSSCLGTIFMRGEPSDRLDHGWLDLL